MKWGGDNIGKIQWGPSVIGKVYFGSDLVYQYGSGPGPTPPPSYLTGYQSFGSPVISGNIFQKSQSGSGRNFVYTPQVFNPGAGHSWIIQTKVIINTAASYKNIIATPNISTGGMAYSIVCQTNTSSSNRGFGLYLSTNGTSWNLLNKGCTGSMPTGSWALFQIVCDYNNGNYTYKQGYPQGGSWTASVTKTSPPIYGYYVGFGVAEAMAADFDLSETKIWIDGELWWRAVE